MNEPVIFLRKPTHEECSGMQKVHTDEYSKFYACWYKSSHGLVKSIVAIDLEYVQNPAVYLWSDDSFVMVDDPCAYDSILVRPDIKDLPEKQ